MATTVTDQIRGITITESLKAPVKSVATTNITLAAEQTVNGVAVTEGDRVLCIAQTSSVDNGIYTVSSGTWQRSPDFDGNDDVVKGTLCITDGVSTALLFYRVTSENPIIIGTSAITIVQASEVQDPSPRTQAEINAGVTPANLDIPSHDVIGIVIVDRYGTNTVPGTTDMFTAETAAQSVVAQLPAGGEIVYLNGSYYSSDTVLVYTARTNIRGMGKHATKWTFNPGSAKARFKFRCTNTANVLYQCSISKGCFEGSGSNQKIGIDAYDISETIFSELAFRTWTGSTSIGIRTAGREYTTFRQIDNYADRPFHITRNANFPSLSSDHTHWEDIAASPQTTTEASILIDADAGISNWTSDGYLALVGGKYGLRYLDGTEPSSALNINMQNMRFEGATDLTGFAVDWNCSANGLMFTNCGFGGSGSPTSGGLRIRNATQGAQLIGTTYSGQGVALDMNSTVGKLETRNCFWQTGSTATLTGCSIIKQESLLTSGPVPETGLIMPTPTGCYGTIDDTARAGPLVSIANNAVVEIVAPTFTGFVKLNSSGTQCAEFVVKGATHAVTEHYDPDSGYSSTKDTTSSLNLYWETNAYKLQNKTGATVTVGITRDGSIR